MLDKIDIVFGVGLANYYENEETIKIENTTSFDRPIIITPILEFVFY